MFLAILYLLICVEVVLLLHFLAFVFGYSKVKIYKLSKQEEQIEPDPDQEVIVARWVCCTCNKLWTLDYCIKKYILSEDKLDILSTQRLYECAQCGSTLMGFRFDKIRYSQRFDAWKK